ncbi:hypothetical protein AB0B54_30610 [Microbispora bryophytorum]
MLVADAARVLNIAPREFPAYQTLPSPGCGPGSANPAFLYLC